MTLAQISTIFFIAYLLGLFVALVSLVARVLRYLQSNRAIPVLLPRDLVLIAGLALPFIGIFAARSLGLSLSDNAYWIIGSGAGAVLSIWVFVYFELFRIGKR